MKLENFRAKLFSDFSIKIFCLTIIVIQLVSVGALASIHNPNFIFDESNTIQISKQQPREILNILSHEQNVPAYYLLLNFLLKNNINEKLIIGSQYVLWVVSIYFFYSIMKSLNIDTKIKWWTTMIYSLCSTIWFYAFFVRMYMLVIVINLLMMFLVFNLKKATPLKTSAFIVLTTALCVLHLGGIVFVFTLGLSLILINRYRKLGISILITGLIIAGVNLLFKPDFGVTFSRGAEYLDIIPITTQSFINNLFSVTTQNLELVFILPIIFIFFKSVKLSKKIRVDIQKMYLYISLATILILSLLVGLNLIKFSNRHIIGLSFALLIFIGYIVDKQKKLLQILLCAMLFVILSIQNQTMLKSVAYQEEQNKEFCKAVKGLGVDVILTEFRTYNPLNYCLNLTSTKLFLFNKLEVIDITYFQLKNIMLLQAQYGGTLNPFYQEAFIKNLQSDQTITNKISQQIDQIALSYPKAAYIIGTSPRIISPEELRLFSEYEIVEYIHPSIYVFMNANVKNPI